MKYRESQVIRNKCLHRLEMTDLYTLNGHSGNPTEELEVSVRMAMGCLEPWSICLDRRLLKAVGMQISAR